MLAYVIRLYSKYHLSEIHYDHSFYFAEGRAMETVEKLRNKETYLKILNIYKIEVHEISIQE